MLASFPRNPKDWLAAWVKDMDSKTLYHPNYARSAPIIVYEKTGLPLPNCRDRSFLNMSSTTPNASVSLEKPL
jgi:hypothetical protein